MKAVSVAMQAHLAQPYLTLATCVKLTRHDGLVLGFTDCDHNLVVDGVTYAAQNSYTRSDTRTGSALAVDNMETEGILSSPDLTAASLRAGLWDYAAVSVFYVNWADLTMGKISLRDGRLGEVSNDTVSNYYRAEVRGILQALQRSVGELTSAGCRAQLGDARCGVNMAGFTFSFTVASVTPDNLTFTDASLTQAGPTGGVTITAISHANPCHITFTGTLALVPYEAVILSGIVGPTALNGVVQVRNPTSTAFDIPIDTTNTTNYPNYVGSGLVTPFGTSGYFEGGIVTWLTGLNAGLSMEVKAFMPGQVTLQLPMPYAIAGGDTGTIAAGCDKARETCRDRFSNIVNMRAEPFLPGNDRLQQIGKK